MDQRELPYPARTDPYRIARMPSQELLEDFLRGLSGPVTVLFDTRTGTFERVRGGRPALQDRVAAS